MWPVCEIIFNLMDLNPCHANQRPKKWFLLLKQSKKRVFQSGIISGRTAVVVVISMDDLQNVCVFHHLPDESDKFQNLYTYND